MNRVIKFRVWDKHAKRFCYFPEIVFANGDNDWGNLHCWSGYKYKKGTKAKPIYNAGYERIHYVMQQYTGLHDVLGREIYEGDVVELGWETKRDYVGLRCKVVYWLNGFYLETEHGCLVQDQYYQFKWCRVIGNTIQNPKLCPSK